MSSGRAQASTPVALRLLKRCWLEIGLALLVVGLFADYLFTDRLLYGSDSIPSGLFFRTLLVDFVRQYGELPRWNPYILGGLPFLDATHGDTFFPSSILHFLFPVYRGMGHKLLLHIFLAGAFAAFYLRTLRLRPGAVAFGAVAYMLSPVFVSYLFAGQDGKMYVTSLFPLLLALLERAMRGGAWRTHVGLGLAIGVTILSAQIQMAYHALWFVGALFVVRLFLPLERGETEATPDVARPGFVRSGAGFALAIAIGLLVASIQLFPAVAYVKDPAGFSVRSTKTDYEHASSWSLHPEEVASLVVPEFCNAPRGYWGRNIFKYNSDYAGIVVLLLAVLAMRRRDATRWYLAGIAGFAILYSLGGHFPLHRLFYWFVPQVKLFRAPPLVMFGAAFGLSALAAHAVHDLLEERARRGAKGGPEKMSGFAAGALAVAAALALAGLGAGSVYAAWNTFAPPAPDKVAAQIASVPAFRTGALVAAFLLAASAVLVETRRRRRIAATAFVVGLVALTVVDEWRVDRRFKTVIEPERFTEPGQLLGELARASREEKFRVAPSIPALTQNEMGLFGIESTFGFHDNELAWYRELRTAKEAENLFRADDRGFPFLQLLNTTWIIHDRKDLPNPLPVAGARPRFCLVEQWELLADRADAPARIADPTRDILRTVLLEEDPGFPSNPDADGAPGTVEDYEYDGNVIRVVVSASRPCLLVQAENWFPYWHATSGGEELPILRADGVVRAIPLGAGRHEILLSYRSEPYRLGKRITLGTVLASFLFLGFAAARGRRRS
ncbi:MAG: hypothetical protein R3B81_18405 [bacterium]